MLTRPRRGIEAELAVARLGWEPQLGERVWVLCYMASAIGEEGLYRLGEIFDIQTSFARAKIVDSLASRTVGKRILGTPELGATPVYWFGHELLPIVGEL